MKQYELWWADLPLPAGTRPVLLLSRDGAAAYLSRLLVVEVTSKIRSIPQELVLGKLDGLPRRCVANLDHLTSVPVGILRERIGALPRHRLPELKRALGYAVGWTEITSA